MALSVIHAAARGWEQQALYSARVHAARLLGRSPVLTRVAAGGWGPAWMLLTVLPALAAPPRGALVVAVAAPATPVGWLVAIAALIAPLWVRTVLGQVADKRDAAAAARAAAAAAAAVPTAPPAAPDTTALQWALLLLLLLLAYSFFFSPKEKPEPELASPATPTKRHYTRASSARARSLSPNKVPTELDESPESVTAALAPSLGVAAPWAAPRSPGTAPPGDEPPDAPTPPRSVTRRRSLSPGAASARMRERIRLDAERRDVERNYNVQYTQLERMVQSAGRDSGRSSPAGNPNSPHPVGNVVTRRMRATRDARNSLTGLGALSLLLRGR